MSFSAEAADLSILDEWAIDYPCGNKSILAKDLSEYVSAFHDLVTNWEVAMRDLEEGGAERWPEETKPYWFYLEGKLSTRLKS